MYDIRSLVNNINAVGVKRSWPSEVEGYNCVILNDPNLERLVDLGRDVAIRRELVSIFKEITDDEIREPLCQVLQELEEADLTGFFSDLMNNDPNIEIRECAMIGLARIGACDRINDFLAVGSADEPVRTTYHKAVALVRLRNVRGIDMLVSIVEHDMQDPRHKGFYPMAAIWLLRCMFLDLRPREDLKPGQAFWRTWWDSKRPSVERVRYPKKIKRYLSYFNIHRRPIPHNEMLRYMTSSGSE